MLRALVVPFVCSNSHSLHGAHHMLKSIQVITLQAPLPCRPPRDNPKTLNTQLNAALANRKLSRFKEFAALYPECCWVFLGDNGQVSLTPAPTPSIYPSIRSSVSNHSSIPPPIQQTTHSSGPPSVFSVIAICLYLYGQHLVCKYLLMPPTDVRTYSTVAWCREMCCVLRRCTRSW